MIRITSLDMPKNDYMKYVRKVIFELNLKDEKEVIDEFPQDQQTAVVIDRKVMNATDDINSNSVLEINHILDSDGKVEEGTTPTLKNKMKKSAGKSKTNSKNNTKTNASLKFVKEEKETVNFGSQFSTRGNEDFQVQTKDFGVSVLPQKSNYFKYQPVSISVGCETDMCMDSKKLTANIGGNLEGSKEKAFGKKSQKRSQIEEFQDIEFIKNRSELNRHYNKNKGKRQKSNDKQKKRAKGNSYDSLKPGSKL